MVEADKCPCNLPILYCLRAQRLKFHKCNVEIIYAGSVFLETLKNAKQLSHTCLYLGKLFDKSLPVSCLHGKDYCHLSPDPMNYFVIV